MAQGDLQKTESARKQRLRDYRDPKKHYVRVKGWLPVLQVYSERRERKVRYLTFCAKEAIDVRYFAKKGVLYRNREGNLYPSLTFIEANDEDYAVISETLGRVNLGIKAHFEKVILDPAHPDHDDLISTFPYDVINLDFCGDIVPSRSAPYSDTLQGIDKVVELQCTAADRPSWHLFLAFRAQHSESNPSANEELCRILDGNLARPEFRTAYGGRAEPSRLAIEQYFEFLRISVAKFLASRAEHYGYALKMESSFVYSRQQGGYHMVKLIAGFTPLRSSRGIPGSANESAAYERTVHDIFGSAPIDVDAALPAEHALIDNELQPVLAELDALGIVR